MLALLLTLSGCKDEPKVHPPAVVPASPTGGEEVVDCTAYTFQGEVYDCTVLDPCDLSLENVPFRLACCNCDSNLCNPDPNCLGDDDDDFRPVQSCMACHNGSLADDYAGPGLANPHPFGVAAGYLQCTVCHGGDGAGQGAADSHVPPPPQLDGAALAADPQAYFQFLTLAGVEAFPDYAVDGVVYAALDWLTFVNPGDPRVVAAGLGCGSVGCHSEIGSWAERGPATNATGIVSTAMFSIGASSEVPESAGLYAGTAADLGVFPVTDPYWSYDPARIGTVPRLVAVEEKAVYGDPAGIYDNPLYDANTLASDRYAANADGHFVNQVVDDAPLEDVVTEAVIFQCGDCHARSRGPNARYGDFRSSGCTACHMPSALDGRSRNTTDPNLDLSEPVDPDAIVPPERSHTETHQIRGVAHALPIGGTVLGIPDTACVGCHQGSNRTVLQYWGIRVDPNRDVVNGAQYPANPVSFATAAGDARLFDPLVNNATFNGQTADQLLIEEDYDGDGRDDTPPDVHYEAGLGCIDCHGSRDLHNGADGDPTSGAIASRMAQTVGITCESCHGGVDTYAATTTCTDYAGAQATCPTDRFGNPLRNVAVDAAGAYWLTCRIDGAQHYVPQVRDGVVDNGVLHPVTGEAVYNPLASYAMGVADADPGNGVGPQQVDPGLFAIGFTHLDTVSCDACHSAWENTCQGCHLQVTYNDAPDSYFFSKLTGERIALQVTNADTTYVLPTWNVLAVTAGGRIGAAGPGIKPYLRYADQDGNLVTGITFSDRGGLGSNPNHDGAGTFPGLSHNRVAPHATRGAQTPTAEGGRNCVACHLNADQLRTYDATGAYTRYFANVENRSYANLDYALLQTELGSNTNNQRNSPYYVHRTAGLGTGLLAADLDGCPVNPLDGRVDRAYCANGAPADAFDPGDIAYDWDKVTELSGSANVSLAAPILDPATGVPLRGLGGPGLAGPLAPDLLVRLADPTYGLVLDAWIDADAVPRGGAGRFVTP